MVSGDDLRLAAEIAGLRGEVRQLREELIASLPEPFLLPER